ncbi:hypothetical protein B0J18DRAFT_437329 [Chaetomium sp. MPI-SDFR-AT-0129]|nr:hypothetical protein B0J18DRAFT_437329 [Chaetomium sp. MPI-SDFR-AT-0129]
MALLGISLILASVVLFCMRRPAWFPSLFGGQHRPSLEPAPAQEAGIAKDEQQRADDSDAENGSRASIPLIQHTAPGAETDPHISKDDGEEQTTPKASATILDVAVPALSLPASGLAQTPSAPKSTNGTARAAAMTASTSTSTSSASSLMPPPSRPPTLRPLPNSGPPCPPPSSSPTSLAPPRGRPSPLPARGPGCSTLAPPPTHSSKPNKPSRAVVLSPGHSPLDWARLTGHPASDLRGLPAGSPYLRVTPSMLKKMTGRKGKDAWTVLGGRVYNITPYLPFHPGGEPELLRGAGRDGTKLFGEIHPWVNYEGMLAACLVGISVSEDEADEQAGLATKSSNDAGIGGNGGDMEAMD